MFCAVGVAPSVFHLIKGTGPKNWEIFKKCFKTAEINNIVAIAQFLRNPPPFMRPRLGRSQISQKSLENGPVRKDSFQETTFCDTEVCSSYLSAHFLRAFCEQGNDMDCALIWVSVSWGSGSFSLILEAAVGGGSSLQRAQRRNGQDRWRPCSQVFVHHSLGGSATRGTLLGSAQTNPDPNASAKVSRYKWEAYRDTNWWCMY